MPKRTPFAPFVGCMNCRLKQKDSFWLAKGVLLVCKRGPFRVQKDYIWSAKGVLLKMLSVMWGNVKC